MRYFATILILLLAQSLWAATYYVDDTNGLDTNPGTAEQPWKTIVYAYSASEVGSTVYIREPNYGYILIDVNAREITSWDDAITFKPDTGHSPVIEKLKMEKYSAATPFPSGMIFDGLIFAYPDQNQAIPTGTSIINVEEGKYIKFLNCIVKGVLHEGETGKSTTYDITLGHTSMGSGLVDVVVQDCNVYNGGVCIYVHGKGYASAVYENVAVKGNTLHNFSHAGVKIDGGNFTEPVLIERNHIYYQNPVRGSHGAGIANTADNIIFRDNILRTSGNTACVTFYQECQNGQVEIKGSYVDSNDKFVNGEAVTQLVTGAKGWHYKNESAKEIYVIRDQEENLFQDGYNIVSDTNASRIWTNSDVVAVKKYGGYENITFVNNLIYDTLHNINKIIIYDVGSNFQFINNTVIGNRYLGEGGVEYYQVAFKTLRSLNFEPFAHGCDANTVVFANNIFVGVLAAEFPADTKVKNNIMYAYSSGSATYRSQTWMDENFPGNKVYNWGQGNQGQYEFNTSKIIFKGGDLFDEYSYTRGAGGAGPHCVDLNDTYKLARQSIAVGFADPNYSPEKDRLEIVRDANPDAGCYEYVLDSNNHVPVFDEIEDKEIIEKELLEFTVLATDEDEDPLTYGANNLPDGASFNPTTRTFSWTPTLKQSGDYSVIFSVTDGFDETLTVVNIKVLNKPQYFIFKG